MPNVIGMCQIYNESTRCDKISPVFFEKVVDFYKGLCDRIIFLDDCSTDNTFDRIYFNLRKDDQIIKNRKNSWQSGNEVGNKIKLYKSVRQMAPDFIISFDFDELLPYYFTRNYLEILISYLKKHILKALKFKWVNLWFSEGYSKADQLSRLSPPRMWMHDDRDKIISRPGFHNILWPKSICDENTLITGLPLLHYSSVNYENLLNKLKYYKKNSTIDWMTPLFKETSVLFETKDIWFSKKIDRKGIKEEMENCYNLQQKILKELI